MSVSRLIEMNVSAEPDAILQIFKEEIKGTSEDLQLVETECIKNKN
jgi:hypothetical protein